MKSWIINIALLIVIAIPAAVLFSAPTSAVDVFPGCASGGNVQSTHVCKDVTTQSGASTNPIIHVISTVIDIVSYIVGAAAVIGLIVSGLRMILANGDSNSVASARNGILYSLIGIIIVVLAQTIVAFVLNKIK